MDIIYRVNGGMPATDLELHLSAGGDAELYLGTTHSITLSRVSRVGTFGGPAPKREAEAIRALLEAGELPGRGGSYGAATSPHAPSRFIGLTIDGRRADLRIDGAAGDKDVEALEDLLQRLALAMTASPIRAIEASLEKVRREGTQVAATVVLRSIGREPVQGVVFHDPANPTVQLSVEVAVVERRPLPSGGAMSLPSGSTRVSNETMMTLVRDGKLPSGPSEVAPDAAYRFEVVVPTKPTAAPPNDASRIATGQVRFPLSDANGKRRLVEAVTPDVPVP